MIETLIILITLLVIGICVFGIGIFMKYMTALNERIDELEKKIDNIQYQTEDVLCDINIVNRNVLNTYGLLGKMKDENEIDTKVKELDAKFSDEN